MNEREEFCGRLRNGDNQEIERVKSLDSRRPSEESLLPSYDTVRSLGELSALTRNPPAAIFSPAVVIHRERKGGGESGKAQTDTKSFPWTT